MLRPLVRPERVRLVPDLHIRPVDGEVALDGLQHRVVEGPGVIAVVWRNPAYLSWPESMHSPPGLLYLPAAALPLLPLHAGGVGPVLSQNQHVEVVRVMSLLTTRICLGTLFNYALKSKGKAKGEKEKSVQHFRI